MRAYIRPGNILFVYVELPEEAEQLEAWREAYLRFDGTALLQVSTEFDPIGLDRNTVKSKDNRLIGRCEK